MEVTKKTLEEIKKELKRSNKSDHKLTSKEIILELAPVIHEQMIAGAKLMDLYEIVKARLPKEARLSPATFKKYWRAARDELGLTPIKASGRKGSRKQVADAPQNAVEEVRQTRAVDTSSDFRKDPEGF